MAAVHAAAAAAAQSGKALVAIAIWQPPGGEQAARRSPCPPLDKACRDQARLTLVDAIAVLPGGLDIEPRILRGQPGPTLVAAADHADDLLVIGNGRHRRFGRVIHGAVSRYCLAQAHCPVLTVPDPPLSHDLKNVRRRRHIAIPNDLILPTQSPNIDNHRRSATNE